MEKRNICVSTLSELKYFYVKIRRHMIQEPGEQKLSDARAPGEEEELKLDRAHNRSGDGICGQILAGVRRPRNGFTRVLILLAPRRLSPTRNEDG
jgi:hypothetical protein